MEFQVRSGSFGRGSEIVGRHAEQQSGRNRLFWRGELWNDKQLDSRETNVLIFVE